MLYICHMQELKRIFGITRRQQQGSFHKTLIQYKSRIQRKKKKGLFTQMAYNLINYQDAKVVLNYCT
jgi:hypothetical protein